MAGERECSTAGCEHLFAPSFTCLHGGKPRCFYNFWDVPRFVTTLPPLSRLFVSVPRTGSIWPPTSDGSRSWLLWHAERTTSHVENTNSTRCNVISIPHHHTKRSKTISWLYTAYHDETRPCVAQTLSQPRRVAVAALPLCKSYSEMALIIDASASTKAKDGTLRKVLSPKCAHDLEIEQEFCKYKMLVS